MKLKRAKEDDLRLDITPLIDVVFLLLIFFMVSTNFERDSEINITLPKASKEVVHRNIESVRIVIDKENNIYIDDIVLADRQVATIKQSLSEAIANFDDPSVVIRADAAALHQTVVGAMDAARQLKLVRITFATQEE